MALFRKKDSKEEELSETKAEGKAPERKRIPKKKKPDLPAPWTKKERTLVLYVFLATILVSSILAANARSWKLPGLPRVNLPSLSFLKGGVVTLEGNASLKDLQKADVVTNNFRKVTKSLSGVYSLFVVDLDTGFSYGVQQNEIMQAASLIKLPVMAGMYMESEAGNLNLDDIYTLKPDDKVAGSGSLYGKPNGTKLTYRELVGYMGQQSDNTAYRAAFNILGARKVKEITSQIGMVSTSQDDNQTTPEDIGLFFKKLWKGDLISEEHRDELLGYMTDTIYEKWLAAGVPEGVSVAHKYGREVHVVNDAGIIMTDKPFVVVILTKGVVEPEADDIFPELSKLVYEGETN